MVDRYRVWLGAGFLAGGMSAAMLTGAGIATADDGASAGSESQPASGSKDSGESDGDASGPGRATSSTGADKPGKHRKDDDADAESVSDGQEPDGHDDVSVDDGGGSDLSDDEHQDDEDAGDLEQEITDDGDDEVGDHAVGEDAEAVPSQPSPSGESEVSADDSAAAPESSDDATAEPDVDEPSTVVPDTAAGERPVEQAARFRIDVVAVESGERPFLRGHPHLVHLVRSNAEIVKLPYGIRLDVDADAERTQFAHGFENEAWNADLVERQRGRKSADTAAGDHHEGLGHTLFLHKARGS